MGKWLSWKMKRTHTTSQRSIIWIGSGPKADVGTVAAGIHGYIQKSSKMKWPPSSPSSYSILLLLLSLYIVLNISFDDLMLPVNKWTLFPHNCRLPWFHVSMAPRSLLFLILSFMPPESYVQLAHLLTEWAWFISLFNSRNGCGLVLLKRYSLDREILVQSTWNQHLRVSMWTGISKFKWRDFMYNASGEASLLEPEGRWRHIE